MARTKQIFKLGKQYNINMHILEELALTSFQTYSELESKLPNDLTTKEEMDLMVEQGLDAVKQKRSEIIAQRASLQPEIDKAFKEYEDAHSKWIAHCEDCVSKNIDPNSYVQEGAV